MSGVDGPADAAPRAGDESGGGAWVLAYFCQRYEGRVEIDADGRIYLVYHPWQPMHIEGLHSRSRPTG